ncbi:MAG: ankyrin repeat domain-containing protein [Acidobacteriia bacterium]|nr:ankyrin repeat domain-containing protein [Terriglobia bacterium]
MRTSLSVQKGALTLGALLAIASLAFAAEPDRRLVNAAADQDNATLRALLKQRVDVNATRADGSTALLWAAHWDNLEIADLLLRAGANVNTADDHGVTPLHQAAQNASAPMVERLLKAGAKPDSAEMSGLTPLMMAAHTANVQVVKLLLAHGANVNAKTTETKTTALMWAVSDHNKEIANVLIAAHADVHASTAKGFTPLLYASRNGDVEMASILLAAGVNANETGTDGTHALPLSIVKGQTEFALFLLEHGADPNSDLDGIKALHAAAGSVDLWLPDWTRKHEGLGDYGGFGSGAFGLADAGRRLRLVKALLAHGADPNARIDKSAMFMAYIGYPKKGAFEPFACGTGDVRGATPLWVAAYNANGSVGGFGGDGGRVRDSMRGAGSGDILRALLEAGANPRLTTDDGTTPLMVAAGLGRFTFTPGRQRGTRSPGAEEAVKILVEAGADVNAVNEGDFTALHGAAFRGLDEVIEYLVAHGANINARDFRGRTPYRLAEGSKQSFQFQAWPETAAVLKQLGANTELGVPGTVQERLRDVPAPDELPASSGERKE